MNERKRIAMAFQNPSTDEIRELLRRSRTVAVVGLSPDPDRPSYQVAAAMKARGYRIIPVNPNVESVLGEKAYPNLSAVPEPIDIVNVFRRPEHVLPIAEEAVNIGAKALWLQEGVVNEEAALLAQRAGLFVVMDMCIKVADSVLLGPAKG